MVNKALSNQMNNTKLNNDITMPLLGLGVYDMYKAEAERAVEDALTIGYRLIDTASMYENEVEIGNAIKNSGINREELFLTTKLNNTDHGYDQALNAFDDSLKKLDQDYVDLYLIHWPIKEGRASSWKALEKLYADKRVKAIGVANYNIALLEELKSTANIVPSVNQIEFSPWLYQEDLLNYCKAAGIQVQSYSPITRGLKFSDERLVLLCKKYGKTPAQIVLNWHLQHGISTIPKSSKRERLVENYEASSFILSDEDVKIMNSFNENFRICDDPQTYL
ncbi:MAG: aldo/keto reductase [Burkholderiaceae bacterium]